MYATYPGGGGGSGTITGPAGITGTQSQFGNITVLYQSYFALGGPGAPTVDTLTSLLKNNISFHAATQGRTVYINKSGDLIFPWTEGIIEPKVAAGDLWIDYADWPMYYAINSSGSPQPYGGRFSRFLTLASRAGIEPLTFNTYDLLSIFEKTPLYPYSRGLLLQKDPSTFEWFVPNLSTPHLLNSGGAWIYSCFAIRVGSGIYFCAMPQISPYTYASFIEKTARLLGTSYSTSPTPSPSGGTPPTSSGGSPTAGTGSSSPPPQGTFLSGLPVLTNRQKVLLGIGAAVGVGGLWYAVHTISGSGPS